MARHSHYLSKGDIKLLRERYLFWLYKTTKDELDKIDRKFTQIGIDKSIEAILRKNTKSLCSGLREDVGLMVEEWRRYLQKKESDVQGCDVAAKYIFLHMKLDTILKITRRIFGVSKVMTFKKLYHEAAMKRIIEDNSGRR